MRAYRHTFGLETSVTNCSNNYGPYHFPEKLIPLFLINCLTGKPLPIYGDGKNVRDWLHVEDHCRGIALVLERGAVGETYNIGGGAELPNLEVIAAICAEVDAAFAADPALAARFPEAPAAKSARSDSLMTYVEDRAATTVATRSTRARSKTRLAIAPRAASPRACARPSPGISPMSPGGVR